jgi:ABC-type branched-subunit amino acid transport system substrate-binding protein
MQANLETHCFSANHRRLLAAALVACAALAPAAAQAQQSIKMGVLLSATGPAAISGHSTTLGIRMATDEINRAGGILGRQVEIVAGDDQSDPGAAVSEAIRLTTVNKVDVLMGPALSQMAIAVAPTVNKAGIFWLSSTTASGRLTVEFAPRHFSSLYSSTTQGTAYANALRDGKFKSVAIIADDGASAQDTISVLKGILKERNFPIAAEQSWHFGDTDMSSQALSLRRANPDVVLIHANTGADGGRVVKSMEDIGWRVPVIGSLAFTAQPIQARDVAGAEALKKIPAVAYAGMSACPNDPVGQSPYAQFLAKLKKTDPANYDKIAFLNAASGYDFVYVLKYAATGAGSLDGDKMAAWLERNASSMKLIYSPVRASKTDHFLLGADSLILGIDVADLRGDGTIKRAGC